MSVPERIRPKNTGHPADHSERGTLSTVRDFLQEPVRTGRHELPRWAWGIPILAGILTIGALQLAHGPAQPAKDDPAEVSIRPIRGSESVGERAVWEKQNAAWLLSHANHLMERDEAAKAEPLLRLAVEKAPGHSSVLFGLGVCLLKQGKAKEAIDPLFEVTRLEPKSWQPHERLAEAYRELGDDRSARKAAREARSLRYPRYARARTKSREGTKAAPVSTDGTTDTEPQADTTSPDAPTQAEPLKTADPTPSPGAGTDADAPKG